MHRMQTCSTRAQRVRPLTALMNHGRMAHRNIPHCIAVDMLRIVCSPLHCSGMWMVKVVVKVVVKIETTPRAHAKIMILRHDQSWF